jgi:hypothetical protein
MVATPEPASKQDSAYVRSFNRYELKYLLPLELVRAFTADLALHAQPDPHSGLEGYPVYSLYWDSPQLTYFWEKLDGEKLRRKLRFRRYEGRDETYVEIKQRLDRTVQKRRTRLPVGEALALFDRGAIDPAREADVSDAVLKEALVLVRRHRLAPTAAVRYQRQAWFAAFEPDLRVTIDSRLQYDAHELDLERPFRTGAYLLAPQWCVLEIKYNNRVPQWLLALVRRHSLDVVRFSKYCAAIDLARFDGRHGLTRRNA